MSDRQFDVPAVSVIVCAFNEERRLPGCIESLIEQDFHEPYEVIIVDDGSTDATAEVGRRAATTVTAPRIRYYRIEHAGLSVARNTGASLAEAEIVAFIDADARAAQTWLGELMKPFRSDRHIGVVGGRVLNLNDEDPFARFIHSVHFEPSLELGASRVVGANMAFRRSIFRENGLGFLDIFDRRGDETSLVKRYLEAFPGGREGRAEDAVVLNESPRDARTWLAQQHTEGRMTARIDWLASSPRRIIRNITGVGLRALSLLAYITLPFALAKNFSAAMALPAAVAWAARHGMRAGRIVNGVRAGARAEGLRGGAKALSLTLLGLAARDAGHVREALTLPFKTKVLLPLRTSVGIVVEGSDGIGSTEREGTESTIPGSQPQ